MTNIMRSVTPAGDRLRELAGEIRLGGQSGIAKKVFRASFCIELEPAQGQPVNHTDEEEIIRALKSQGIEYPVDLVVDALQARDAMVNALRQRAALKAASAQPATV